MMPVRKLLYHRGIDDHVGTYITDYVFSCACFVLCIQLLVRISYENKKSKRKQTMKWSCWNCYNWLPWNWPKEKQPPVTMTTYAVLLLGFSNVMMALLGGLTHQFLQMVEPYHGDVTEVQGWLAVWRAGASFSAFLCLALLIMAEQLLAEEKIFLPPRKVRIAYYVIVFAATLCLFCYNYVPLIESYKDPFSIRLTFIISFAVMFVYGVTSIIVFICNICCRNSSTIEVDSPLHSIESGSYEAKSRTKGSYRKTDVSGRGDGGRTSRIWELILTMIAPWSFLSAGIMNYLLKSKCSDSHSAYSELGCPLPDSFNHNALMHVVQIISVVLFFVTENMAISKKNKCIVFEMKRATTSSTICNDANSSCAHTYPESPVTKCSVVSNGRFDDICKITMTESNHSLTISTITQTNSADRQPPQTEVKFPSQPSSDVKRPSAYDNLPKT